MIYWFFGPPGSGKTHVAKVFSEMTGLPRLDGDDFHTAADRKAIDKGKFTLKHRHAQLGRIATFVKKKGYKQTIVAHALPDPISREILRRRSRGRDVFVFVYTPKALHHKRLAQRKNHHFSIDSLPGWLKKHWQDPKGERHVRLHNGTSSTALRRSLKRIARSK